MQKMEQRTLKSNVPQIISYLAGQSRQIKNYLPGLSRNIENYLRGLSHQIKNYLAGLFHQIKNELSVHLILTFFFHLLYFALFVPSSILCYLLYHMLSSANILLFCVITSYSDYTLPYPSF